MISCKFYNILIDSFTLQEGELIKDVLKYVLMQDPSATSLIGGGNLTNIQVIVFRLTQSLDDPTLLFWRPFSIKKKGEWPNIFFIKLTEGKLLASKDLGASV